jgi:hypothetical protein
LRSGAINDACNANRGLTHWRSSDNSHGHCDP